MGTIRKIGTYKTEISNYIQINIRGEEKIDLGNSYADYITKHAGIDLDDYMGGAGRNQDFSNRSLLGGNLNIEWHLELEETEGGITSIKPVVDLVNGAIQIEDIPVGEDPDDFDLDLETFDVDIDSKEDRFKLETRIDSSNLTNQIFPEEVSIDFKTNTITVDF